MFESRRSRRWPVAAVFYAMLMAGTLILAAAMVAE